MAQMPGASYKPINYSGVPKMRKEGPNVVIFHTIVGHDPAPAAHFSLGGYGELTQSRDTAYQSAACLDGNPRAIAVETEDTGAPFPAWSDGHDVPAWTDSQVEDAIAICVWAHQEDGIPLELAADSKTGSAGIAYHRQGIDGNFESYAYGGRVEGGEHWSTSFGKVCPGDRRIKQLIEIVIPRAREAAGLESDMDKHQAENLEFCTQVLSAIVKGQMAIPTSSPIRPGEAISLMKTVDAIAWRNYSALNLEETVVVGTVQGEGIPATLCLTEMSATLKDVQSRLDALEGK